MMGLKSDHSDGENVDTEEEEAVSTPVFHDLW